MKPRYLFPSDYMADPSANVFNGRLYIYPSHDWEAGAAFDDDGGHFQMKDYHVLSLDDVENGDVTDHGVILDVSQVAWAEKQMWDNDVVEKNGKYYLIFSAKDYNGVFHLGVAVADKPEGPFVPQEQPMRGSMSIDPCVFKDEDGQIYVYFGGLWGGQLQWYQAPQKLLKEGGVDLGPAADKKTQLFAPADVPALSSFVVRLSDDVMQFAEAPHSVVVLDENGEPLKLATRIASSRPHGCISITVNTISLTLLVTAICSAMLSVTILMDRSPIRASSSIPSWAGPPITLS